jgi:hypothetical protein
MVVEPQTIDTTRDGEEITPLHQLAPSIAHLILNDEVLRTLS